MQVNDWTQGDQTGPHVVALGDGGYFTFWNSQHQDDASSSYGVYGQRFDARGQEVGPEIRINDLTAGDQVLDDAAVLADGRVLVLWEDRQGADGSGYGQYGTILTADGAVDVARFQVADATLYNQTQAKAVALDDGRFFVVYSSEQTGAYDIRGRIFASDGTPEAASFQINTFVAGTQQVPRATLLPDGDVMVAWGDYNGADGDDSGIIGQRIDVSGNGALVSFDGATAGADETVLTVETANYQYFTQGRHARALCDDAVGRVRDRLQLHRHQLRRLRPDLRRRRRRADRGCPRQPGAGRP